MSAPLRVAVISPRALVRAGWVSLLRAQPFIFVVGEGDHIDPALDFDVTLWDAARGFTQFGNSKALVIIASPQDAAHWLHAGAAGCILETDSLEELLSAIRQVARGEMFLSRAVVQQLVQTAAKAKPDVTFIEPLTEREREVLQLLAQGLSNKDIAQKLYLSVRTVEGHLLNIYSKLRVKSRTEAVLWAVEHKLDM